MKTEVSNHPFYQAQIRNRGREDPIFPLGEIRAQVILKLVGRGKKILDLGCGTGWLTKRLEKVGNHLLGLDISPQTVKQLKKKGITAYVCNLELDKWPIKGNSFDTVVAAEIIEHLLDPDQFLKNIRRVLKNGGQLILSTPNTASLGRRLLLLLGRNPLLEISYDPTGGGHVRYFCKIDLLYLLEKHRFRTEVFTSDVILFNSDGSLRSSFWARIFPSFGKSLIIKATKLPNNQ